MKSIQDRFEEHCEAHPEIYEAFVRFARDVKSRGFERYGAKAIGERIRWHFRIEKRDEDFKLNNDFIARYARLIQKQEPDLYGFFETRCLREKFDATRGRTDAHHSTSV